ncbi:MAG TPA: ribosomal protein S18-alanine N-acetyltransferase [Pyrinomonadaceae bacterium]|jgi:ribosomal-protein-alanine N-acetyltransferase
MTTLDIYQANGFDLSPMTEHDLLEVVEIEEECGLSRWGWDGYYTELLSEQSVLMFVARPLMTERTSEVEQVAGFIAARMAADDLHINNVAVREQYRRRGIGGALLAAVLERGKERGAQKAFLEVRAGNVAAQGLYARYGFEVVGKRANYYSAPSEDALVMVVPL